MKKLLGLFTRSPVKMIKHFSDHEYLLMDMLLITLAKQSYTVAQLQYVFLYDLKILVQQPVIREAINELKREKLISFDLENARLS